MSINHQELLPKLVNDFGNIYVAVNYVAAEARRRQATDTRLSESRAITWVLSGKIPEELSPDYQRKQRKSVVISVIEDHLQDVSDDRIKAAVKQSIIKSIGDHHLLYEYLDVLDEGNKARVRVITNMIWYKLETLEEVY